MAGREEEGEGEQRAGRRYSIFSRTKKRPKAFRADYNRGVIDQGFLLLRYSFLASTGESVTEPLADNA